ncbi:hypothetical protein ABK040_004579 [Willaertia magna]
MIVWTPILVEIVLFCLTFIVVMYFRDNDSNNNYCEDGVVSKLDLFQMPTATCQQDLSLCEKKSFHHLNINNNLKKHVSNDVQNNVNNKLPYNVKSNFCDGLGIKKKVSYSYLDSKLDIQELKDCLLTYKFPSAMAR